MAYVGKPSSFVRYASLTGALLGSTALTLAAAAAHAQAAPANVDEIVVTGSRVAVTGFQAPTPTTVVGGAVLDRQGATGIAAVLNQVPAFKPTKTPGANATNTSSPVETTADLRGLGAQRTLVLVNGSRVVPELPAGKTGVPVATDLSLIPSLMIDRVEVVTGGASAQYGSDAVAGVVNIILKNKFEGLEAKAQAGVSQQGDYAGRRFGIIAGHGFLDGRAHLVGAFDFEHNEGVRDLRHRDWAKKEYQIVTNPDRAGNGQPAFILSGDVRTNLAAGGYISAPANFALRGQTFNKDGTTRPFNLGAFANNNVMIGGEDRSQMEGIDLVPKVRRSAFYTHGEFEVTPSITAFAEFSYAEARGILTAAAPRLTLNIQKDNAYLPAAVVNAMTAANITNFTLLRGAFDIGNSVPDITNKTPHVAVGLNGKFGGTWNWDARYEYSENRYHSLTYLDAVSARLAFATDAVASNGQIVCRATLPGATFNAAAAGCVPINFFGEGNVSGQAANYVTATANNRVLYTQSDGAVNLRGEPFSTWAGPVSIALGGEYRRESEAVSSDPIANANGFINTGNAASYSGNFDVKEGYVEALVPLLKDVVLAKSLALNGAVRVADYSTVGQQTTWKYGATWEPITGLRFRSTKSQDIRAPAIFELYSPGAAITNAITVQGRSATIPQNTTIGNPNLDAEVAKTITAGVVVEPGGWLRGLSASVDYYDINVEKAITNLSGANVASLCTLGRAQYCSLFNFNAAGTPTSLTAPALNAASFQNIGYDIVVSYNKNLADFADWLSGSATTSFNGTYVKHAYVDAGAGSGPIDRAGENGQANLGATPRFRYNLSETYTKGPLSLTAQLIFISKGKIDNTYNTGVAANTININKAPAVTYLNLYGSYDLSRHLSVFGTINNAFDKDPPPVPYAVLSNPTNGIYYDKVGRAFQVGIDFKY